jgi:predicted Zn-dependent protease
MKHCALTLLIIACVIGLFASPKLTAQQDTVITIYGKKFAPGVEVYFNGQKLQNVERISSREIKARIPLKEMESTTQSRIIKVKEQPSVTDDNSGRGDIVYMTEDSITVKNPSPSRGTAGAKIFRLSQFIRRGNFIGKWTQRTIKLYINDQTPREIIKELAAAVQALNEITNSKIMIELDTINLVSERPTLVLSYIHDGKNVLGMADASEIKGNIAGGRTQFYPPVKVDFTTIDSLQSPETYHFQEVDIVLNRTMYNAMQLRTGEIPADAPAMVTNLTWAIAHELGHLLGLTDTYSGTWMDSIMRTNLLGKNWLGIPVRDQNLLKQWYDIR